MTDIERAIAEIEYCMNEVIGAGDVSPEDVDYLIELGGMIERLEAVKAVSAV